MITIENQIIQKTIRDNDKNIVSEITTPGMFESVENRVIWSIIIKLVNNEQVISFMDIRSKINENGIKQKNLLHDRLNEIENGVYWYDESSLDILRNEWQNRLFKNLGTKLSKVGTDYCTLQEAQNEIVKYYEFIKNIDNEKRIFISLEDIENIILNRTPEESNNRINIKDIILQRIFGYDLKPRFYIVAGLPSMGKNIVVDKLVCELMQNYRGIYFSFDNSAQETGYMLEHIITQIPYDVIENNVLDETNREIISKIKNIRNNLYITSRRMNIDKIRMILEKFKNSREWGNIRFFVIDYFQNIPFRANQRNEVVEYEHMSKEINKICSDLGLTAIVISQSRDKPREDYVKFYLGDLKWCGGLAQDSFYVIGLEGDRNESKRTIKIAKHKRGKPMSFDIEFNFNTKDIIPWVSRG